MEQPCAYSGRECYTSPALVQIRFSNRLCALKSRRRQARAFEEDESTLLIWDRCRYYVIREQLFQCQPRCGHAMAAAIDVSGCSAVSYVLRHLGKILEVGA